jgi:hypothetical protein
MWLAAPIWPVPENAALPILKMPFAHVYFSPEDRAACDLRADIFRPSCIDLAPPTASLEGMEDCVCVELRLRGETIPTVVYMKDRG